MAQIVGFTGSRHGFNSAQFVQTVAKSVSLAGHSVAVGCASGVDALVRQACPNAQVFKVASPGAGLPVSMSIALARRSQAMVSACNVLVGFASVSCPNGVSPLRHFCGGGSGTWASLVYAISQGKRVFVFLAPTVVLPAWSGGAWVQSVPSGLWAGSFTWQPSASQLSLL